MPVGKDLNDELLKILVKKFLKNCKQRVVLNCQVSSLANALTAVPQEFILGLLFFLVYLQSNIYSQILNYLLTIHFFLQFYVTKISQPT